MNSPWRWLWSIAIVLVLVWLAWMQLVLWPGWFFPYCVTQDRLSLCSDRPFAPTHGRHLLSDVTARLALSPLDDKNRHSIFVSNTSWNDLLFMRFGGGAAAFSIYPRSRNVFTRHADIDANTLFHASGEAAQPPRTFVYYMAHEVAHDLTGEHVGVLSYIQMPLWVREGYADYVGMGGAGPDNDPALLYARYRAHDPIFDSDRSYFRYRMLTAYFLRTRGWSVDTLLSSTLTTDQAQHAIDQDPRLLK